MPVLITCPQCGLSGDLPDERLGTLVGCPQCKAEFPAQPSGGAGPQDDAPDGTAVWVGNGAPLTQTPPPARTLPPGLIAGRRMPPEVTPENAPSQLAWVRAEVARFEQYVAAQLDMLRGRREELARIESDAATAFVQREQELNRDRVALDARSAALDVRADELTRAEDALNRRLAEAAELEEGLRAELEEREAEVERERRAVDEAARAARKRAVAPPPVAANRPAPDLLDSWMG